MLILQVMIPFAVQAEDRAKIFEGMLNKNNSIAIKLENEKYWYRFENTSWEVLKSGIMEGGGAKEVIFLDVNKNHINDIFVKLFEVGANSIYALFIASEKDGAIIFSEYDELFGSPHIDDRGQLVSIKRDGPFSIMEFYMAENGRLYRNKISEPISSELEKVTSFRRSGEKEYAVNFLGTDIPATACVYADRAYLSKSPSAADVTKSYIIKGDGVSIIDSAVNGEWLKIRYHGRRIIDGWLPQAMLSLREAGDCMRDDSSLGELN